MGSLQEKIIDQFGKKLRIRVCGICIQEDHVLVVNHHALNPESEFWSPPGGGMDFESSAEENLVREYKEETGLDIRVDRFLFVHEFLHPPLHAIELFFLVSKVAGEIKVGIDPEMGENEQIIKAVEFKPFKELKEIENSRAHQVFKYVDSVNELLNLSGYRIWEQRSK